mmetsp:Transcript_65440/g.140008  ORF Transcript_65440/g.140008 Transcript_65440/m.140008 type:complete len:348 (+) Transcript_65440:16-1059(+)
MDVRNNCFHSTVSIFQSLAFTESHSILVIMMRCRLDFFGLCIVGLACSRSACALKIHSEEEHEYYYPPSLQAVMPIEWVHVPKCGTSFVNTLIHIPGFCPGFAEDFVVSAEAHTLPLGQTDTLGEANFALHNTTELCNTSTWDTHRIAHHSIDFRPSGGFNAGKGRFMMFVRQPEQLLLSSYQFYVLAPPMGNPPFTTLTDFIPKREGIVTKILTRAGPYAGWLTDGGPPTRAEIDEAKLRLQTGFAFIGDTDQWDLSICLFNTMFNQVCRPAQFSNSRPSGNKTSRLYDTTVLNGWRDPYDNEVYDVAMKIFETNLRKFNVSESSCQPCWREAGLQSAKRYIESAR